VVNRQAQRRREVDPGLLHRVDFAIERMNGHRKLPPK